MLTRRDAASLYEVLFLCTCTLKSVPDLWAICFVLLWRGLVITTILLLHFVWLETAWVSLDKYTPPAALQHGLKHCLQLIGHFLRHLVRRQTVVKARRTMHSVLALMTFSCMTVHSSSVVDVGVSPCARRGRVERGAPRGHTRLPERGQRERQPWQQEHSPRRLRGAPDCVHAAVDCREREVPLTQGEVHPGHVLVHIV